MQAAGSRRDIPVAAHRRTQSGARRLRHEAHLPARHAELQKAIAEKFFRFMRIGQNDERGARDDGTGTIEDLPLPVLHAAKPRSASIEQASRITQKVATHLRGIGPAGAREPPTWAGDALTNELRTFFLVDDSDQLLRQPKALDDLPLDERDGRYHAQAAAHLWRTTRSRTRWAERVPPAEMPGSSDASADSNPAKKPASPAPPDCPKPRLPPLHGAQPPPPRSRALPGMPRKRFPPGRPPMTIA
jgi:hypothetical protein